MRKKCKKILPFAYNKQTSTCLLRKDACKAKVLKICRLCFISTQETNVQV